MRNPITVLQQKFWPVSDRQVKGDWYKPDPIRYQPPDSVQQSDESWVPRRPGWMISRRNDRE